MFVVGINVEIMTNCESAIPLHCTPLRIANTTLRIAEEMMGFYHLLVVVLLDSIIDLPKERRPLLLVK